MWYQNEDDFWLLLEKVIGNKILDIGCYDGRLASNLVKKYKVNPSNIYLIDRKNRLSFQNNKKMNFCKLDIDFNKLPYKNNSFDLIIAMQIIEHVENPHHLLREINRVLKKNGYLVLGLPNGWSIFSRLRFLFKNEIEGWHKTNSHISFLPYNIFKKAISVYKIIGIIGSKRERGWMPPFCWFNIKYKKGFNFSNKLCYFLKK